MLGKLKLYGLEEPSMDLLSSYLANRTQLCSVNGVLSGPKPISCGIPQGSILGPLLFLVYINDLPRSLEYSSPRMFADDTTLTVSGKSMQEVEGAINHDLANVKRWLCSNKLSLNLVKDEYLLIGLRYNINNLLTAPNFYVGDTSINRVRVTKALESILMSFYLGKNSHVDVDTIAKKSSSGIAAIRKLKSFIDRGALIGAYNAVIAPHFDYYRAARVITGRKNEHGQSELTLDEVGWKPLSERRTVASSSMKLKLKFVASSMYKITHNLAPKALADIFLQTPSSQYYNLRGSSTKLFLPHPHSDFLKKGLSFRGAKLWNSLSEELRTKESILFIPLILIL